MNDDSEDERSQKVSAQKVYELFKGISDEDCRALGMDPEFARPEWMVWLLSQSFLNVLTCDLDCDRSACPTACCPSCCSGWRQRTKS